MKYSHKLDKSELKSKILKLTGLDSRLDEEVPVDSDTQLPKSLSFDGFYSHFGHNTQVGRELGSVLSVKSTDLKKGKLSLNRCHTKGLQVTFVAVSNKLSSTTTVRKSTATLTTYQFSSTCCCQSLLRIRVLHR